MLRTGHFGILCCGNSGTLILPNPRDHWCLLAEGWEHLFMTLPNYFCNVCIPYCVWSLKFLSRCLCSFPSISRLEYCLLKFSHDEKAASAHGVSKQWLALVTVPQWSKGAINDQNTQPWCLGDSSLFPILARVSHTRSVNMGFCPRDCLLNGWWLGNGSCHEMWEFTKIYQVLHQSLPWTL